MIVHRFKKIVTVLLLLTVILFVRHLYNNNQSFHTPDISFESVDKYISKGNIDYDGVFEVTGLSPCAAGELVDSGRINDLRTLNLMYFDKPQIKKNYILYPFTAEERNTTRITPLAPLRDGDILVTFATQTCDWRHGHCAIVVNADSGLILEHMAIGVKSCFGRSADWGTYPNFAVLRYPDAEIASAAARYAKERLHGIDYNLFAGIIKKDKSDEPIPTSSHCSHIVWQAYKACGVDIDCDRSFLVTPHDVAMSGKLKVVQIYGLDVDDYKNRLLK